MGHFVAITPKYNFGVGGKIVDDFFTQPATIGVLKEEREIPLVLLDNNRSTAYYELTW
jgi:hypothetical protein